MVRSSQRTGITNEAEYDLLYVTESEKGLAVRQSEDHTMVWLPKSKIEFKEENYKRHQVIKVIIPDWLAEKHDLA